MTLHSHFTTKIQMQMDLDHKRIFYDHGVSKDYLKEVQEHKL